MIQLISQTDHRPVVRRLSAALVACFAVALVPSLLAAQEGEQRGERGREERPQWDPAEYLQRLDRDGNRYLDETEMSGRSGRFLERMGFDRSRPVSIDRIISRIQAERDDEARAVRREEIEAGRKVPKFGLDSDLPPVAGFGEAGANNPGSAADLNENFDEQTTQVVEAYMNRYDENNDGFLAGQETRRVGRLIGGVSEADADKDGKLSPQEIATGFQRQQKRRQAEAGRRASPNSGAGPPATVSSASGSSWSGSRPAASNRSLDERVTSYVDDIFKKYDTDKNGSLSKQEREKLRVPFPDPNGDGIISRQEATAYISGSQKSGGSVSPAVAGNQKPVAGSSASNRTANSDQAGSEMRRDLVLTGRTTGPTGARSTPAEDLQSAGASGKFRQLDTSEDGQLQFAEFTNGQKLSDALYQEFLDADANDDGVITPDEFK